MLQKNVDYLAYVILTVLTAYGLYIQKFCWSGSASVCKILDFGAVTVWIGYSSILLALLWLYVTLKFLILKFWNKKPRLSVK